MSSGPQVYLNEAIHCLRFNYNLMSFRRTIRTEESEEVVLISDTIKVCSFYRESMIEYLFRKYDIVWSNTHWQWVWFWLLIVMFTGSANAMFLLSDMYPDYSEIITPVSFIIHPSLVLYCIFRGRLLKKPFILRWFMWPCTAFAVFAILFTLFVYTILFNWNWFFLYMFNKMYY